MLSVTARPDADDTPLLDGSVIITVSDNGSLWTVKGSGTLQQYGPVDAQLTLKLTDTLP